MRRCHVLLVAGLLLGLAGAAKAGDARAEAREAQDRLDYAQSRLRDAECELAAAIQARDAAIYSGSNLQLSFNSALAAFNRATGDLSNYQAALDDAARQHDAADKRLNDLSQEIAAMQKRYDASISHVNRLQKAAMERFESSPANRSALSAIEHAEWRLDCLFAIHDSFVFLYEWRMPSPDLPGESIVRRAIGEHELAVANLKNLRDEFERTLAADPTIVRADAIALADGERLNELNAEAERVDADRAALAARLQELDQVAAGQQATVMQIQTDLDRWQNQLSWAEAAICSAEERVQIAAAEVVCARDFRDDAAAHLRRTIERYDTVVIIPDRGPRFRDEEPVEVVCEEEKPERPLRKMLESRPEINYVHSGQRGYERKETFRNEGDVNNERDRAERDKNERIEQQKRDREERDRQAQQERLSAEERRREEDNRNRDIERKRQNDEQKQAEDRKRQDDDRRKAEERKSRDEDRNREEDRKRDDDRKQDEDRKRDDDSRKSSDQKKEDRGKRYERN